MKFHALGKLENGVYKSFNRETLQESIFCK